jgi:hypothetical protein
MELWAAMGSAWIGGTDVADWAVGFLLHPPRLFSPSLGSWSHCPTLFSRLVARLLPGCSGCYWGATDCWVEWYQPIVVGLMMACYPYSPLPQSLYSSQTLPASPPPPLSPHPQRPHRLLSWFWEGWELGQLPHTKNLALVGCALTLP